MHKNESPAPTPHHRTLATLEAENGLLREQLALRDLALDGTPITFVIADRTTPEPTIIYCNRMAAEIYGLQREDISGTPLGMLARFISASQDSQRDYATLSSGQKIAYESETKRVDGTTFWRGITEVPVFDSTGRLIRSIATGADITAKREAALRQAALQDQLVAELKERERMQSELQLAQKLESVGRLAAGIAHEINTPIQYITDSVNFLGSAFDELFTVLATNDSAQHANQLVDIKFLRDEVPRAIERTIEGTERVATIVRSMKEFSHPDASEKMAADLNRALKNTLMIARSEYKYVATVDLQCGDLPEVMCNIGELSQVFLNLIVNSSHALADAGRDTETGRITIKTGVVDGWAELSFEDNGCGILQAVIDKIYDPFFTTKEVGRGTGQGLAIARSIVVDKHSGRISVQSTPGTSTCFTLRLPLNANSP
jgi:two-component system NtrC family sensor kinase